MSTLAKSLLAAQKEMGVALKDSKNPFFKSKYADLNAVIDACVPVLNKHGISVLQPTTHVVNTINGEMRSIVRTTLLHEDGETMTSDTEIICSKPNDPQAMGSAISYARRYGLQAFVVLKAEDDDGNAGSGKQVESESVKTSSAPTAVAPTAKRVSSFSKPAPAKTEDDI